LAEKIANGVAEGYIAVNLERRYEASAYARDFLEKRLQQLKVKLAESEKQLVAYAEAQELVTAGDNQNLSMTNLAAANDELARVTKERLRKEQLWRQVDESEGIALPQIMESGAIGAMRAKRVELATEYEDKLSVYKPAFPEMKQIQGQIDELDRQIAAEAALIKETTKAEYEAARQQEQSLVALVETLKGEVTDVRNRNIQYTILQREVDTNRSLYEGLLQRYKEIGVAGGVGVNNVSIVDLARVPGAPYTPRMSLNLAFALMLGLMFGGAGAFVREHFDDTFKSPEDVEENLGLPLLGIIPLVKQFDGPAGLVDGSPPIMAEAVRSLRTALQFSTAAGVPKSLLVTSSRAEEGKSTTALMLAMNFAQLGMRVLLIDADLRKPTLHEYLDIDPEVGLSNFLAGATMPPEALQKTEVQGLTVLASGPLPPNPAELLASAKMLSLLTIAGQEYDLIIIDGPPVAGLADAPMLASMASGTLLIIDANATRKAVAKAALKRLHFARAQVVGAAVNKLDLATISYDYGYGYGYGDTSYYGPAAAAKLGRTRKLAQDKQRSGG
jgi:capsular exopolysaccharide synthesis family protein